MQPISRLAFRIYYLARKSLPIFVALGLVAAVPTQLNAQTTYPDQRLPENDLVGPPAPPNSSADPGVSAGADMATSGVSPETLKNSDAAATQRLRFDAGDRVFFSAGSAELGSRARLVLSRQARWLIAWNASVVIAGHADEGGAMDSDERVALQRAEAVRDRLREEGISPEKLQVLVLGRREPIADCPEPACAVQNRRVVIHVMSVKTEGGQR